MTENPEVTTEEDLSPDEYYYGEPYYRIGDVVKDEDEALWFCLQPSGCTQDVVDDLKGKGWNYVVDNYKLPVSGTQYSWFISLTPTDRKGQSLFKGNGSTYTNLPTRDQARIIGLYLTSILWSGYCTMRGTKSTYGESYTNILNYAKVDLTKLVVRRDSLFDALANRPNHMQCLFTNVAYSDDSNANSQGYIRFIHDNCGLELDSNDIPTPGSRMNVLWSQDYYTTGEYTKPMRLQDLTDANTVRSYAYDKWVTLPWYTLGNRGKDQSDDHATDIYPHEKIRSTTYAEVSPDKYLWNQAENGFANPEYTSMYKEPVIMCRIMKVIDRGQPATKTTDGKKLTAEYLVPFTPERGNELGMLEPVLAGLGAVYYYNGVRHKVAAKVLSPLGR